jgi:hypothetical protein
MNAIAAIPADVDAVPVKERRVSRRMREFIHLVVTGECATQKAACERIGLHPGSIARELRKAHVRVFMERATRDSIASGMMRAGARLNELINASSEHVSADVSKHVLAIAGIKPAADTQVSVNIDIKAGYVIDLTDDMPIKIVGQNTGSKLIDG